MISRLYILFFIFIGFVKHSKGQAISNHQKAKIEVQVNSLFLHNIIPSRHLGFYQFSKSIFDQFKAGFISDGNPFVYYDSLINNLKSKSKGIAKSIMAIWKEKITERFVCYVLIIAFGKANVEIFNCNIFIVNFFFSLVCDKTGNDWKVIPSYQSSIRSLNYGFNCIN